MKKRILKQKTKANTLDSKTKFEIMYAALGEVDELKSARQIDAYILGFTSAWSHFTNSEDGKRVFDHLNKCHCRRQSTPKSSR